MNAALDFALTVLVWTYLAILAPVIVACVVYTWFVVRDYMKDVKK